MARTLLSPAESALLSLQTPPSTTSQLFQDACQANAQQVLTSELAKSVFHLSSGNGKLEFGVKFPSPSQYEEEDLLALGVAALHAYAQVNWTGPSLPMEPISLFSNAGEVTNKELNEAAVESLAYGGEPVYHLAPCTTFLALALQIFGLVPSPFSSSPPSSSSSVAASLTPFGPSWHLESIKIWRLRAGIMWIKVLDEPVPLPTYITSDASSLRLLLPLHSSDRAQLSLSLSILANLLSRSSPHSNATKEASILAKEAAKEEGLEWELTGRMGKRTKWQRDEKTQLVVLARDGSVQKASSSEEDGGEKKSRDPTIIIEGTVQDSVVENTSGAVIPEVLDLNDDTLLERTAFTSTATSPSADPTNTESTLPSLSSIDPSSQPSISSFSQSVLLALSISTLPHPTSLLHLSSDVLSTSQVTSFVSRVLIDPQNWSVHSMALLLRCRAEAGRSRTVERGVLQMQALVDQLRDGSPTQVSAISSAVKEEDKAEARVRLEQFHALAIPPAWEMEKELAVRYLSLGISKSALEIFERLEMWEEVARCYVSLERTDKAIEVIKDLLVGGRKESDLVMGSAKGVVFKGGEKREAKLWCTLGELEVNSEHYEKAWEVSRHTSSRAQRSLGATYWANGEWDKARHSLRLALKINPLFPRTWFVLGCCDMRAEDWKGAQEAFGRCVALEDDDAESWSNLASCHLRRAENEGDEILNEEEEELVEEGVDSIGVKATATKATDEGDKDEAVARLPFSRKRAAFYSLQQAIKHNYESWRIWLNYMIVAVDVGEMSEACRALGRIVDMRAKHDGDAAVDLEVLERLVDAVTRDQGGDEVELDANGEKTNTPYLDPNVGKGLAPRVERLISVTILPVVTGSPRVYLAHARLLFWQGDFAAALEAHLKAYRVGVAADPTVERERVKFLEGVEKVEEVVGMLENLGPKEVDGKVVAKDWKFQARSLVRTFLGRTKDAFEDEPEYEKLKEVLAELK